MIEVFKKILYFFLFHSQKYLFDSLNKFKMISDQWITKLTLNYYALSHKQYYFVLKIEQKYLLLYYRKSTPTLIFHFLVV